MIYSRPVPVRARLLSSRLRSDRKTARHAAVLLASALTGASLAPLIGVGASIDPMLVRLAMAATTLLFVVLSVVSLMCRTRRLLMIGSILGTVGSILSLVALVNLFVPTQASETVLLWGGLFMFSAHLVLDTQVMVLRCMDSSRPKDVPRDALLLWLDLIPIFVRILVIFIRENQQNKRNQRRSY